MKIRKNIIIKGIVQGVGFRPFIHKLVKNYNLSGWVLNSNQGVEMDIEGKTEELNNFISDIKKKLPPLARIEKIEVNQLPLIGYKGFPDMIQDEKGWWYLPKYKGILPLTFTLRAKKI